MIPMPVDPHSDVEPLADPTSPRSTAVKAVVAAVATAAAALLITWGAGADLEESLRAAATAAGSAIATAAGVAATIRKVAYQPATVEDLKVGWQFAYTEGVDAERRQTEAALAPMVAEAHAPPPDGVTVTENDG